MNGFLQGYLTGLLSGLLVAVRVIFLEHIWDLLLTLLNLSPSSNRTQNQVPHP